MTQNHSDIRTRFIFDDMPIRGMHIRLEKVWHHIVNQKHYPVAIRRALGELLAAGALLSANLKNEARVIVQVQGSGPSENVGGGSDFWKILSALPRVGTKPLKSVMMKA